MPGVHVENLQINLSAMGHIRLQNLRQSFLQQKEVRERYACVKRRGILLIAMERMLARNVDVTYLPHKTCLL